MKSRFSVKNVLCRCTEPYGELCQKWQSLQSWWMRWVVQQLTSCWTHYSGSWLCNLPFAHFAGVVRSPWEPRSLTNICFQVYAGTDCHSEAPTSALCRGTVVVLAWCQTLLKAHFSVKQQSLSVVAEGFGSGFGDRWLTSRDLTGVYFLAFSVLPKKWSTQVIRLNLLEAFLPNCFGLVLVFCAFL